MIITSLLDTDLYKFTMMQVVLHQFPGAQVEYRFKCRNPGMDLAAHAAEIREEIRSLCSLQFQESELAYLRSMRFIKSDFVDFLGLFRLNEKYITVTPLANGELDISIVGPWLHTILFEIPVLAIVNEVYFRNTQRVPDFVEGRKRLETKIEQLRAEGLEDLKIADYGTRRRFSRAWHDEVLRVLSAKLGTLQSPGNAVGPPRSAGRHQQCVARHEAGAHALGHHGPRIPASLSGPGPALAGQPDFCLRVLGPGVPRRPGHCAQRCVWHERVSARLRHVLLQALRWRAPRQRRPVHLGRAHDRPLPAQPGQPAHQNLDLQRRLDHSSHHRALPAVPRALPAGLRHRHQSDQ